MSTSASVVKKEFLLKQNILKTDIIYDSGLKKYGIIELECIEKKEDNFVEEVMSQAQS